MRTQLKSVWWGVAAGLLFCLGCSNQHADLVKFLKDNEHLATATEYRVGIPDEVLVSAPRILEIDGVRQTVGVDGKVSFRLLGPVRVAGLTPREIAAKLEEQLTPYYEDPKVQVEVTSYKSKKYYVFGEVARPGGYPYTGKDSVIDALSAARPTFIALRSHVQVIRPTPDPQEQVRILVNMDEMVQKGDMRMNVLLEPGDMVYVPPTPLGWAGNKVREVLYPLTPAYQAYKTPAEILDANDEYTESDER